MLARRVAGQVYGLRVKGSAGVLVQAKKAAIILTVRPLLQKVKERGFVRSDRLIERSFGEVGG